MSKEVSDVLNRLNGTIIALQAIAAKVYVPPPPTTGGPNTTFEQQQFPVPLPPGPKREDYEECKKLAESTKGLAQSLEDYIDKVLNPPGSQQQAAQQSEGHSAPKSTTHASGPKP